MAFTPRFSKQGMLNNPFWYSNTNPFYASGYGLPNCTCYAWGRSWEITGEVPALPTGNGGQWWGMVQGYETGQVPKLGAVMCFDLPGDAGHVAVVEAITKNGDVISSNSGYSRNPGGYDDPKYFWTETNAKSNNYRSTWEVNQGYIFQGFIYNIDSPGPQPFVKKGQYKFWLYKHRKDIFWKGL